MRRYALVSVSRGRVAVAGDPETAKRLLEELEKLGVKALVAVSSPCG